MESEPMLTPREIFPPLEAQRRVESATLHHAGQRAQYTTNEAIPAPSQQSHNSSFETGTLIAVLPTARYYTVSTRTGQPSINIMYKGVFNHQEGTRSSATSDRSCPCLRTKHLWPSSGSLLTVELEVMRKQTSCQKWDTSWSNLHTPCPTVKQRPS